MELTQYRFPEKDLTVNNVKVRSKSPGQVVTGRVSQLIGCEFKSGYWTVNIFASTVKKCGVFEKARDGPYFEAKCIHSNFESQCGEMISSRIIIIIIDSSKE